MTARQIDLLLHDRPISKVLFSNKGDLIITAGVDSKIGLWNLTGELFGTYDGHLGAVTSIDCNSEDKLLSGGFDCKAFLWDIESGKQENEITTDAIIKNVNLFSENEAFILTTKSFQKQPSIILFDKRTKEEVLLNPVDSPTGILKFKNSVVFSDDKGTLNLFDLRKIDIQSKKVHSEKINELTPSYCGSFFITASADATSKVVDFTLDVQKTFTTNDPINSAAIFRTNDKVITAGGMSARDVTLTKGKMRFDVNFHDIITTEIIGSYSPHFGTINTLAVHPSNEFFISGGEDGLVSLTYFGEDFLEAPFTEFK